MVSLKSTLAVVGASAVAAQQCQNVTIPVHVNSTNMILSDVAAPYPTNQSQVTSFVTSFISIPQPQTANFVNGTFSNVADYNISATYCRASNNTSTPKGLQILVHGIGFDRSYWDFTNATSYTTPVRAAGYDTLAIDRLGCGTSSHPEGRNELQTNTHIEALRAITMMASNGSLPSANSSYSEIVHVGHSYGSIIINGLVTKYPSLSQGIVLTGFSSNGTWVPQTFAGFNPKMASVNAPTRFGNMSASPLNNTYLTWTDIYNNELVFFKYPYYNQSVIEQDEATKQPVTYGEIVTLAGGIGASNFTGPVHVVTGHDDFIFCGGNASATGDPLVPSIPSTVSQLFQSASNFSVYTPLNTGHAVQLHYSNQNTTQEILSFLSSNNL